MIYYHEEVMKNIVYIIDTIQQKYTFAYFLALPDFIDLIYQNAFYDIFAVKFQDGSMRPRATFVFSVLKYWGVGQDILKKLSNLEKAEVLGGGKTVGYLQAVTI